MPDGQAEELQGHSGVVKLYTNYTNISENSNSPCYPIVTSPVLGLSPLSSSSLVLRLIHLKKGQLISGLVMKTSIVESYERAQCLVFGIRLYILQGCKSFRFSLISDFFIKLNFKGARANLKSTF